MRKVKALTTFTYKDQRITKGEIVEVENNDAVYLIDTHVAELYKYSDKMVLPEKKKGYVIK